MGDLIDFSTSNKEPFVISRVTTRDVTDFKEHLRRDMQQAVATVNRCLVTIRRFFRWLTENGHAKSNPAKPVKELRRQQLSPTVGEDEGLLLRFNPEFCGRHVFTFIHTAWQNSARLLKGGSATFNLFGQNCSAWSEGGIVYLDFTKRRQDFKGKSTGE